MNYWFLFFSTLIAVSLAQSQGAAAAVSRVSNPNSNTTMATTSDLAESFYKSTGVVHEYATQPIAHHKLAQARKTAQDLLDVSDWYRSNWNYGNAVHYAHLVLGRVALLENNLALGIDELTLAGQTPGSAQLNTGGPNMRLAQELLEKGESFAVLRYFDSCLLFWKSKDAVPTVNRWKDSIAAGQMPDFGGHLDL